MDFGASGGLSELETTKCNFRVFPGSMEERLQCAGFFFLVDWSCFMVLLNISTRFPIRVYDGKLDSINTDHRTEPAADA